MRALVLGRSVMCRGFGVLALQRIGWAYAVNLVLAIALSFLALSVRPRVTA